MVDIYFIFLFFNLRDDTNEIARHSYTMLNLGLPLLHNSSWTEGILPYLRDTVTLDPNVVKVCFLLYMLVSNVTTHHSGQKTGEETESK